MSAVTRSLGRHVRLSCLAGAIVLVSSAASAQGLLEVLFGVSVRPAPPPIVYALQRDPHQYQRSDQMRATPAERGVHYSSKPAPYVAPEVLPGPLGRFLRDPTLRRGDVVATSLGLMVYRGGGGSRHKESDFVPVAGAGRYVAGRKTDLAALDQAMRRAQTLVHSASRMASAEAVVTQGSGGGKRTP